MTEWLVPDWPAPDPVVAVATTRTGGVRRGPYASMNLGAHVGDDATSVRENRRLLQERLGLASEPAWLSQVHGNAVVDVTRVGEGTPEADAAVSRTVGTACAVLTADCLPVLFAARDGTAVGAAHAGWRGLAAGVLENAVAALRTPPGELLAWLGPAISQPSFEVGLEVRDAFVAADPAAEAHFERNARGRLQADLYGLARLRLVAAGVTAIYGGGWCTYEDTGRFFSYRRDKSCGRMATVIALRRPASA